MENGYTMGISAMGPEPIKLISFAQKYYEDTTQIEDCFKACVCYFVMFSKDEE